MTKMAALLVLVLAPQGETYNRPDRRSPGGQGALEGLARAIGPFRAVGLVAHDSSILMYVCCTHVIYVCMHGCMYACMYAVRTYVCMSAHAQAAGRSNKRNLLRNHQPFSWFRSKSEPIGPQSICMYPPPHNRFGLRFSSFSTTQTIVCRSFENFQQNSHFTDVLYWLY